MVHFVGEKAETQLPILMDRQVQLGEFNACFGIDIGHTNEIYVVNTTTIVFKF